MSAPLVTLQTDQGPVSIFASQSFANIEQLATYLQLRINGVGTGDLVAYQNGQLALVGPNEQYVNLSGVTLSDGAVTGPPGPRGPAGPTGQIAAGIQIGLIFIVVIVIVGIMIAFGDYLAKLDEMSM